MKSSMFLFAALVLCALPSALGSVFCYHCTPNITTGSLCNNMTQYTMTPCQYDNSTCYTSTIMSGVLKAYVLGCVDHPATCDTTNETVCQNAMTEAMSLRVTIDMCMIECPVANSSNNPLHMMMMSPTPTTTMTTMMTTSVTTEKPITAAAEKLCPKFLGVLFIILFTILRQ